MIIKGLFRRYQRWNPVHPTAGAFWGMGIGIGCGVGWGPGFGPEVIGYVGAGCGVGFSVGITLAGVGIGLPLNIPVEAPYKALIATRSHAWQLMQSSNLLSVRNNATDEWNRNIPPPLWTLKQKANESLSYLKELDLLKKGGENFRSFRSQFSDPREDVKEQAQQSS